MIQQHLTAPPPSLREALPAAPVDLDAAIRRATAKRREDRYATVHGLIDDLRRSAQMAPTLPIGVQGAIPPPQSRVMSRPLSTATGAPFTGPGDAAVSPADGICDRCEAPLRAGDAFCRSCGLRRSMMGAGGQRVAAGSSNEGDRAQATFHMPLDAGAAPVGAADLPGIGRRAGGRRRRATAFNQWQWLALGTAAVVVVFINAVGLWLARAGAGAAEGNVLAGVTEYIFTHLAVFKSALTALALVLAAFAVYAMRTAIIDSHAITPQTYQRLRQYHRMAGYGAVLIAVAVGFLTCIAIFGL